MLKERTIMSAISSAKDEMISPDEMEVNAGFGFGIVAVLYLLLIGIIIMNRDRISTKVLNEVIAAMTANDDKNNATNDEQPANPTGETDF